MENSSSSLESSVSLQDFCFPIVHLLTVAAADGVLLLISHSCADFCESDLTPRMGWLAGGSSVEKMYDQHFSDLTSVVMRLICHKYFKQCQHTPDSQHVQTL